MAAVDRGPGDAALWSRAAHGDHDAFGQLFDRHAGPVYSYLFRLTANWSEAEDLTSAVFLQAWRRRAVAGVFVLPGLLGGSRHGARPSPGPPAAGGQHATLTRRTESSLVSSPVTGLVVQGSVGAARITGGDRSTVAITAHLAYRGGAPVITRQVTGGVLELGYRLPSCRDCGVSLDLTVPRGLGVTVRLGVGQIQLSGLSGTIAASTGVGDIRASGMSGSRVRLTTGPGMISAGFTAPARLIFARSGIGSVTIRVPSGTTYRVTASVQTGSVRVSVPRAAASSHVIQATTGTGTVTVTGS